MSLETLTLLTTIATFIAAFATFLTVLEMRWQRRTTYKPDLIVESSGFDIYPDGTNHFGTIATDRKRPAQNSRTYLSLTARNAGFGPAKNVMYSWETDFQGFLESIGRVDASVVELAEYDAGRRLRLFGPAKRESTHNLTNQLRGRLPAIMPDVSSGVSFPSAYMQLLVLSLNVRAERETQLMNAGADVAGRHLFDMGAFEGWPPLTLTLSCQDLGGYKHTKRFNVQPEVAMLHFDDVNSEERSASIALTVRD